MTLSQVEILLVDENHTDVGLIQEILQELKAIQFQLTHLERIEQVLAHLSTNSYSKAKAAIVVILVLNSQNQGTEAVRRVYGIYPDVPIIVLSSINDEAIAMQALQMGAQDYLIKEQINSKSLVATVRYAIERCLRIQTQKALDKSEAKNSALRNSKQVVEATYKAKSEFIATMSHELRTPLNAILGLSHLLMEEFFGSLNPKQKEYISCIHSSGEHLLELINDILDLSKVEAGKEELTLVSISVWELCNYCLKIVQEQAYEKGLQITSQIDNKANICIGDERRVRQILLNLLTNAIKFTLKGKVSLSVKKVDQGIAFTVSDTGIGIAAKDLKFLFEPFRQLDSELSRMYEGTGLGLALTRKLARLHGGDITVQSTLGIGSQFTFFLPEQNI